MARLQPNAEIVDICLQSVDILKKFLHRQWTSDEEMAAAVNPLLSRIAALTPEESAEETQGTAAAKIKALPAETSAPNVSRIARGAAGGRFRAAPLPQTKSVRISLDRLDRMMNAVGELVINRTRMLGRLAELSKLVEVLNFSKGRLAGKVSEFQEKARIQSH